MSSFAVETRGLAKRYGDKRAVDGLDLQIKPGIIYGFLGPNGCGKTTTLRMLSGLLEPSGGEIFLMGSPVHRYSVALRSRIGYMSQRFSLYNELSCFENLKFYAGMYGLEGAERSRRMEEAINRTRLQGFEKELVGNLSGGWRQRVALCAAMMHRPELLFLDEPTSGVDPVSGRLFWEVVYELAAEGVTVVASTHAMNEAEHCDEVGFLSNGRLIRTGSPRELKASLPGRVVAVVADDVVALAERLRVRYPDSYLYGNEIRIHLEDGDGDALSDYAVRDVEPTLEDLFVYLTEGSDVAAS